MQKCQICFEFLPDRFFLGLPCNCQCCQDCLVSWCGVKIKEPYYLTNNKIPCITGVCNKDFKIEEIIFVLSPYHQNLLNDKLLQIYMSKAPDIRKCPRNNCPYGGIIEPSCSKKLHCSLCGKKWREKDQFSSLEKILYFSWKWRSLKKELFSGIWKRLRTKRCPKCRIRIQKTGGCQHMTCQRCKYEFCWICAKKHPRHSILGHWTSNPFKFTLTTFIFLIVLLLILSFVNSIPQIQKQIGWFVSPLISGIKFITNRVWDLAYWTLYLFFTIVQNTANCIVIISPEPIKTILSTIGQVMALIIELLPTMGVLLRLINSCITYPLLFLIRDIFLWILTVEIKMILWILSFAWDCVAITMNKIFNFLA